MIKLFSLSSDFSDFLVNNAWWIAIIFAVLILLVVGALIFASVKRKHQDHAKPVVDNINVALFGGQDNIISITAKGSRLNIVLKDYALANRTQIKEKGFASVILMSDRLVLVHSEAQAIAVKLNKALEVLS